MLTTAMMAASIGIRGTAAVLGVPLLRLARRHSTRVLLATVAVLELVGPTILLGHELAKGRIHDSSELSAAGVDVAGSLFLLVLVLSARHLARVVHRAHREYSELESRATENAARLTKANQALETEVAEHKLAAVALHASETKYRIVANRAHDWEYWVNPGGDFVHTSPSCQELTGYAAEEFLRDPGLFERIVHADDLPQWRAHTEGVERRGTSGEIDYRIIHSDGSVRWLSHVCQPVTDDAGEFLGTRGSNRDISDRKQAEEAWARLVTAVEQSGDGIVITDVDGRVQYANPAFEHMTGFTRPEVRGQNLRILKSGHHDETFYSEMWKTILRGETWTGRMINRKKDGTLYQEDATISPVRDGAGRIVSFVATKRDVTREVALEAQLHRSQKMEAVGRLAGGVAHEINNVLTAVLGYSELIADHLKPDDPGYRDIERIQNTARRGAELIGQLVAFSRQQIVRPRVVNLNTVAANAVKLVRPLVGERIRIESRLQATPALVRADPAQVQQLLTNLCLNAHDAMPQGGTLTIETSAIELNAARPAEPEAVPPGRYVVLAVRDTGCGMDPQTRARLFEPFFTTQGLGRRAGLGLATVYGIVRQHGGHIEVHSVLHEGTAFHVYLPQVACETEHATKPDGRRQKGETILLVEDEAEVREIEREILTGAGYTVLAASSADEAVELCDHFRGRLDLLVTDIVMPGMSGRELAGQLLRRRLVERVLYISGYADSLLTEPDRAHPGTLFLSKPFSRAALLAHVRAAIDGGPPPSADSPVSELVESAARPN